MIGAGAFRRQQQENQIDRLIVERLEIDRPVEPGEQSEQPGQSGHLAVRNGDAVADRGRAELFALHQDVENRPLVLSAEHGRARGKLLQHLLLAVDLERRENRVWRDQIVERHEWNLRNEAYCLTPISNGA